MPAVAAPLLQPGSLSRRTSSPELVSKLFRSSNVQNCPTCWKAGRSSIVVNGSISRQSSGKLRSVHLHVLRILNVSIRLSLKGTWR